MAAYVAGSSVLVLFGKAEGHCRYGAARLRPPAGRFVRSQALNSWETRCGETSSMTTSGPSLRPTSSDRAVYGDRRVEQLVDSLEDPGVSSSSPTLSGCAGPITAVAIVLHLHT